ncbi:MAG: porin [Flavobacteriales bacterium]|nr:porin [Flavobacteriales bacterium]
MSLGRDGIVLIALCCAAPLTAQDSSVFKLSGYAEVYYAYDLSQPPDGERPDFLFNHKRHNEFNANLALLQASYSDGRVRGALGLMAGNYVQYNLADEPDGLRNVYEARVGIKLSRTRELWVDAGIFPSHIGFEGVIGQEQVNLTRSIVAENSPYYETGAVLNYAPGAKWSFSALALNGWQRIQREAGNQRPSFGTQVRHTPDPFTTFIWSTFVGSVGPDSAGAWRFYSNLYGQVEGERSRMVLGLDVGLQEASALTLPGTDLAAWMSAVAVLQQQLAGAWWMNGRIEFFLDERAVMINEEALLGASVGIDRRFADRATWRVEYRLFRGKEEIFRTARGDGSPVNMAFTTALCLRF